MVCLTKPNVIQRGIINRPLNEFKGKILSQALSLDYMGSSEYEWGATRKSLLALKDAGGIVFETFLNDDDFSHNGNHLRIAFPANVSEQFKESYIEFLRELRTGEHTVEYNLVEPSNFNLKYLKKWWIKVKEDTDFWWDLRNHVMWSYDKLFMKRLNTHLKASWTHMAKKAAEKQIAS